MLEPIEAETIFEVQNHVEDKVIELIRYLVIEAVKHGHELSVSKFYKTATELERLKGQKQRMITQMRESTDPLAVKLSKEIIQADILKAAIQNRNALN